MSLESRLLDALQPWRTAPHWRVAFSGGLDSTVLLHLLARLSTREQLPPISAIHVHHGLQPAAEEWPTHCQSVCERLGVTLRVAHVQVASGPSLERAAREARYEVFSEHLKPAEVLLTAQHRDDQAETMLFRLLRGAGVRGLAGMPAVRALGEGWLVRPLMDVGRNELEVYAREHGLVWVEDPSNQCFDHSRNFLRHRVMPVLQQRWPSAATSMVRAAKHLGEAQHLLNDLAEIDLRQAHVGGRYPWLGVPSLCLSSLRTLSPARQRNALRHWLVNWTTLPDTDHWAGWDALRDAASDAAPIWPLADGELHRGDGRIWWLSGPWLVTPSASVDWLRPDCRLQLPGNGSVRLKKHGTEGSLQVRYRRGGESLNLPGRGHRDLKRLLNEAGLPSFARARLPLLYCGDELVAVANLPQFDVQALSLSWTPPADARFELMGSFE
ncbi:tRNA lysidine(34) synthetase TilS [Pseudomonas sp. KSR10]|uniref:tRNA lysidine(34) synthetase TilS n=1 Tax=Pseudomonas sp. KSR10 TaxID=2916654 RepID=UPI001EF8180B|nr:tRNA lysidine(34) synthetase TilS [Pseudomonas sp. KSR10]MCG6540264.1 tRNA lysidine(34) synthetase TilS [Pseudomonas sp. KSR10]